MLRRPCRTHPTRSAVGLLPRSIRLVGYRLQVHFHGWEFTCGDVLRSGPVICGKGEAVPTVVQLPTGKVLTVSAAADAFLDSLRNPNTVRSYSTGVGKTAERIGEARPLGSVADDEIGEALELLWGTAAVNTWNARRAAVLSWLGWCESYGYDGPAVPAWTKRLAVPDPETPARSKMAVDRLIARREVRPREKTLWRDALRDRWAVRGDPRREH